MIDSRRPTFGWPVGFVMMTAGVGAIVVSWIVTPTQLSGVDALQNGLVAFALIGGLVLSHRFPIRLRGDLRLDTSPVALFLLATLLPIPLAITGIGLGELIGEIVMRRGNAASYAVVATETGKWILLGLAASLVAHAAPASGNLQLAMLLGSASVFWIGNALAIAVLRMGSCTQSLRSAVVATARESGLVDAPFYAIGVLGALAATQSTAAVVLVFFPAALIYRALKGATELDGHARDMLGTVANASSDAVLVLDTHGRIVAANRQAVALSSCPNAQSMIGGSVADLVIPQDRHRIEQDLRRALLGGSVTAVEYTGQTTAEPPLAVDIQCSSAPEADSACGIITCVMRDMSERKRVEKVHTHRALNDPLTGLPGPALLFDRLEQCLARARREALPFAICLLDLDQVQRINDVFGHRSGDLVLKEVGTRLRRALRDSDTVARLGGDDFAVLLPSADEKGAVLVATRLMRALNEPYQIDDRSLEVTASMGIALYPEHGDGGDDLMERANAATRIAKSCGSGFSFYEAEHGSRLPFYAGSAGKSRALEPADRV